MLAVSNGLTGNYNVVFREVQYWNTTIHDVVKIVSPVTLFASADVPYEFGTRDVQAPLDLTTGRVTWKGPPAFPRWLVIPQPPLSVILDWHDVAQASYIPAKLVHVDGPLQARSTLAGVTPDGYTDPATPAEIKVYAAARPRTRCVFADLLAPQAAKPRPGLKLGYRVSAGKRTIAKGTVASGKLQRVYMPVEFGAAASTSFSVKTSGKIDAPGGTKLGMQIGNYEPMPHPCPVSGAAAG
jgi:hypothetical protein